MDCCGLVGLLRPFLSNNPSEMTTPLSITSFLSGTRTTDALTVIRNPFFNVLADRESAEVLVSYYGNPVLRHSSRIGLYAVTYYCLARRTIVHTLIRQNADLSVDVLTDAGVPIEHYASIYDLLTLIIWGPPATPRPLVEIAPALVPLLPTVVTRATRSAGPPGGDEDPSG